MEPFFFHVDFWRPFEIQATSLGFLQDLGSSHTCSPHKHFYWTLWCGRGLLFFPLQFMGKNYLLTLAKCKGVDFCAGVWQFHGRGVTVWSDRLDTATSFPFSATVQSRHPVHRWEWKQTYFGMLLIQFCMVQLMLLLLTTSNITQFSKHLWKLRCVPGTVGCWETKMTRLRLEQRWATDICIIHINWRRYKSAKTKVEVKRVGGTAGRKIWILNTDQRKLISSRVLVF